MTHRLLSRIEHLNFHQRTQVVSGAQYFNYTLLSNRTEKIIFHGCHREEKILCSFYTDFKNDLVAAIDYMLEVLNHQGIDHFNTLEAREIDFYFRDNNAQAVFSSDLLQEITEIHKNLKHFLSMDILRFQTLMGFRNKKEELRSKETSGDLYNFASLSMSEKRALCNETLDSFLQSHYQGFKGCQIYDIEGSVIVLSINELPEGRSLEDFLSEVQDFFCSLWQDDEINIIPDL